MERDKMMELAAMRALLKESLPAKRFKHSVNVYETALELAEAHHLPPEKVAVAALLHDCGREVGSKASVAWARELVLPIDEVELAQPILLHAKLGVYNAMHKYGVADQEILDAIRYHTTGMYGMSKLAKIVFLADMIEPGRDFPGVEQLRRLAFKDLDAAMLLGYANTMRYLVQEGLLIHPHCVLAYNELIMARKDKEK
jgi:predicted HD superfamily hydrolase involved in NAD metabolism